MHRLTYHDPSHVEPSAVRALLLGEDCYAIQSALVAMALGSSDLVAAYDVLLDAAADQRNGVRATAVLCFGHLGRIHGRLPDDRVIDILVRAHADADADVWGQAENATSDIRVFMPALGRQIASRLRKMK